MKLKDLIVAETVGHEFDTIEAATKRADKIIARIREEFFAETVVLEGDHRMAGDRVIDWDKLIFGE
jgi:hypothetical protein